MVNIKIKGKPKDENILCVLSLRSTVILKDNIIQVFMFYICGTITIKTAFQCQSHLESDQTVLWASSLCLLFYVQCAGNLPLLITHTLLSGDLVWLNLNFEEKLRLPTLYENGLPESITPGACPLFYEQKGTTPQRLTGGTGLYMNYSIILTEISFYPETSILLQIIRIIHMTFWIIPEFDR